MNSAFQLKYKKARILYSAALMVEQSTYPDYNRSYGYSNKFIGKLFNFIFSAKSYDDQLELSNDEILQAAKVMDTLPYRDSDQKQLWMVLMLLSKITYSGD